MLSGRPILSPALIIVCVLGNTMTAVAVAARLALDTLKLRAGEVEAALSLGLSERDHESSGCRQNLGWPTICV
jgi:ABC-type iron transport system FetAB permease component